MPASISVFLNSQNLDKSLEFYTTLGAKVKKLYKDEDGTPTYADLNLAGAEISLGNISANDDPAFRQWVSTPLGAGVIVYVTVTNVDRWYDRAVSESLVIETPITDRSYGRLFTVNDPDGYTITFITEGKRTPRKAATKKTRVVRKVRAKRGNRRN